MLFIEWWILRRIWLGLFMVALGAFGLWAVRNKVGGPRQRVLLSFARTICVLIGMLGASSLLLVWWVISTSHVYSAPIYSPNRRMAARVDDYNAGGFGGAYDNVELFTGYGFRSEIVFSGGWNSIDSSSLRWKSDTELDILTRGSAAYDCASTVNVKVRCSPK
jgi:hypothetical protein